MVFNEMVQRGCLKQHFVYSRIPVEMNFLIVTGTVSLEYG
jgi:hypothetical protein